MFIDKLLSTGTRQMKPFVKLLNISPLALAVIMTLSACETMEGIKQDISSIDFSNLTTA